jgi:hypothetical protein
MRFPFAASAATTLALLTLGTFPEMSGADAAPRCPLGQILRVSKGVCVPKSQNLALLRRYSKRKQPVVDEAESEAPPPPAPAPVAKRVRSEPASAERAVDERPQVKVAQRETAFSEEPAPPAAAPTQPAPASPFGSLYVGAFRSTLTTGFSVGK